MRILSLDVGEKRIGIARADSSTRIAVPLTTILVDGTEFAQIEHLIKTHGTTFLVLGMPRSNAGNETAQSLYVRNFAKVLTEKIPGIKIRFQDESLTSVEAERRLKSRKKPYQKADIDAEAASIILQDFLETFREKSPHTTTNNTNTTKSSKTSAIIERKANQAMLKSKKVAHRTKIITGFFVVPPILVILVLFVVGSLLWYQNSLGPVVSDCSASDCSDVTFPVTQGESLDTVATNLKNAKLVNSAFFFQLYLRTAHPDLVIQSGTYSLNPGLSAAEIAERLRAGAKDSNVFSFTIIPNSTIFNVKEDLLTLGYSNTEINNAFAKEYDFPMLKNRPAGSTLEGYLMGETFEFYQNDSVEKILTTFLDHTQQTIDDNDLSNRFAAIGLSLHEGITLASLVQSEISITSEQPTVAQIFLSRLGIGMPLGSDASISYALDVLDPDRQQYTDNSAALQIDSCYNTRRYAGLPCGPISSPTLSALLATANPSPTSYLFFLTGDDGKMYYSYTQAEHDQNIYSHCQKLCGVSL